MVYFGDMPKTLVSSSAWTKQHQFPELSLYPPSIQRLIRRLKTPEQVQKWILTLRYNPKDTMRNIHGVIKFREAHCLEAVLTAAAILEHHGHPPLILDFDSADALGHTLLLFRRRRKFGTIGMSRDVGLNGRKPVFKTIHALVQSYAAPYIDAKARITKYGVLDLRTLKNDRWRGSPKQTWYVEKELIKMPHRKLRSSPEFIKTWRKRYVEFLKKHPGKKPTFYPLQKTWM